MYLIGFLLESTLMGYVLCIGKIPRRWCPWSTIWYYTRNGTVKSRVTFPDVSFIDYCTILLLKAAVAAHKKFLSGPVITHNILTSYWQILGTLHMVRKRRISSLSWICENHLQFACYIWNFGDILSWKKKACMRIFLNLCVGFQGMLLLLFKWWINGGSP